MAGFGSANAARYKSLKLEKELPFIAYTSVSLFRWSTQHGRRFAKAGAANHRR